MADKNNNTGSLNTGSLNTGSWNTGDWNTGDWNTGDRSTGDWNTGDRNTGDWNTGYWNTGYRNTGDRNTGSLNTGNWNTGSLNTGNWNTGYCNTGEPKMNCFDKPCDFTRTEYEEKFGPMSIHPLLTEWIDQSQMTAEEKIAHPEFDDTGGFLKKHDFKEAFIKAWNAASDAQKKWFTDLPNFDAKIFFEITGVNVAASTPSLSGKKVTVTLDGQTYSATID